MRAKTLEILWHGREPVLSVDVSHDGRVTRLATAGADRDARIWLLRGDMSVSWAASLSLPATVNVARFAPASTAQQGAGRAASCLATGGDAGDVVVWARVDEEGGEGQQAMAMSGEDTPRERWVQKCSLRGHLQDVLDIAWARSARWLASASVDNSVIVWDVEKERKVVAIEAHNNYVQGVAWDPSPDGWLSSLSSDRFLKTFQLRVSTMRNSSDYAVVSSAFRIAPPQPSSVDDVPNQPVPAPPRLFASSGNTLFFRRLAWAPDGSFLACPAGILNSANVVHLFSRSDLSYPVAHLTGFTKPAVAIRFNPCLFQHTPGHAPANPLFALAYRVIFAVASADGTVVVYDSSRAHPIAHVGGLHPEPLTDISWDPQGTRLWVSSLDGYVSIVEFTGDELGAALPRSDYPKWMTTAAEAVAVPQPSPVPVAVTRIVPKKKAKTGPSQVANGQKV